MDSQRLAERLSISIEQAGRLDRLMGKFSQKKGLTVLHPIIEKEVCTALKACNITEPVLVLQNENLTNSACYLLFDEDRYPVKAMAIGVGDERGSVALPLIRWAIYHECGHLVANDLGQNSNFPLFILGGSIYLTRTRSKT